MEFLAQLADVIHAALEQFGMTPQQLAQQSRVDPSKLDALLLGRPAVNSRELRRIAEMLELDPSALQMGVREPVRSPAIFLRHASQFQDFRHDLDGRIVLWVLERGIALAALSPQANEVRRAFQPRAIGNEVPAHQGYRLASEVRQRLGLEGTIEDICAVLEKRLAVAVYVRELATPTPAIALCANKKAAAAVIINLKRSSALGSPTTRVSLAHELCHILFDPVETGVQVVVENETGSAFEKRARAFAAELLCPKAELQAMFPRPLEGTHAVRRAAEVVAARFGVNLEPALRQLQNRLHTDKNTVEQVLKDTSPGESPSACAEDSRELRERVSEGWRRDLYSTAQARAYLGLTASEEFPWTTE